MAEVEPDHEDVFDIERIRLLVQLMEQHDLSEVDLRRHDQRIRLRRGTHRPAPAAASSAGSHNDSPPIHVSETAPLVIEGQRADDKNIVLIKSPMVGTFYSKPTPDSEPFVRIGQHVSPDTTVCIIEAMKVFNEIPAEVSGTIVAMLVENEEAVDYGRPLFRVDTSK